MSEMIEQAVLGGILQWGNGKRLPVEVLDLEPEYFSDKKHAIIFAAIQELIQQRKPIDEVSVLEQMKTYEAGPLGAFVVDLVANCPCCINLGHWAGLLAEEGRKQEARAELDRALNRTRTVKSHEEVVAIIADSVKRVKNDGRVSGLTHVKYGVKRLMAELEQESKNPESTRIAATGIRAFDMLVEMRASQLTIVAGRPGMGKSALAGNIAAYCAKTHSKGGVALFSLEMDTTSFIRRMMSGFTRIATHHLPAALKSNDAPRVVEGAAELHGLDLFIDDRPGLTVDKMRTALMRIGEVRLVIVDYLQLIKTTGRFDRNDLRVGSITKDLKALSKDFSCHVVCLSQLNRGVEARNPPKPVLSDLRDSGNIEEDADNVWLLYRPGYYNPEAREDEAEIYIAKQRHGRTGLVKVKWEPDKQMFSNLDLDRR